MTGEALVSTTDTLKPSSVQQGVKYVSDNDYISSDINADVITRLSVQNALFNRAKTQQMNLIFPNPYTLKVFDQDDEIDEDLSTEMKSMCDAKDVNLWMKMQLTYNDVFEGGAMISNPVWKYENNTYTLTELNHLPWQTFASSPGESFVVASEILTGIGIDDTGQVKFYQKEYDGTINELTNVVMIKNPITQGVAGTPLCVPIVPLINASTFSWNAQMQKVNRVGAPTPFLSVEGGKPGSTANGGLSDEDYAQMFLKNYSKDILMPIRGDTMELVDGHMDDNGSALETLEYLNKQIIDYWSPSSMIQKDGNSIGGSDAGALGLLMRYVSSVHEWIENPFEELLQIYLDANGYEGYRVEIEIPEPEIDNTKQDLDKIQRAGLYARDHVQANELRGWFGLDPLEEFEGKFIADLDTTDLRKVQPELEPSSAFQNTEDRPTVKQAEKGSEKGQKDVWDVALDKASEILEDAFEEIEEGEE